MIIIINWFLQRKRLLLLGIFLAGISTSAGIFNNFEWFHKGLDNWPIWGNFNKGAKSILFISNNPQIKDIENVQTIVIGDSPNPHFANPRVSYLMDTDPGFENIKSLLINNLFNKPTYEVNAIISQQVAHRGADASNPQLAQRIVSLIPIPETGRRYETITAEAYRSRQEVTTESFLLEWIKSYKKTVVFTWCLVFFAIGIILQLIYHLGTRNLF